MEIIPATLTEYLRQDFARRRVNNSRFSMRSYAKMLEISPAHLSLILASKRTIKAECALKIATQLGLTPSEALGLYGRESGTAQPAADSTRYISNEEFSVISQWYYYAILALAGTQPNVARPEWIAMRLGIPKPTAEAAFQALIDHKYIEVKAGQFRQCTERVETAHDVPSAQVRRYHKQNLQLAAEKLDSVDVCMREFVSMTIAVNKRKIKAAKEMIRKFKAEFCTELDRGNKSEVYTLAIQFFPLTDSKGK